METVDNYLEIKHRIKKKYDLDLVVIQSGPFFEAIEEDADSLEQELGWTLRTRGTPVKYPICSAPATNKIEDFLVKRLHELGFSFAILRLIKSQNNSVVRKIVRSTNEELIGIKFSYRDKNEDMRNFLQAILEGADPRTGEILNEDSAWKHPKIIADIQSVLAMISDDSKTN